MKRRMNARVVVLESVVAPLYWLILAASVWILFRGHNEPGGGFIGGLVAVAATVLWGAARGPASARHKLPFDLWLSTVMLFDAGVDLCVWGAVSGFGLGLLAIDDDVDEGNLDAMGDDADARAAGARKGGRP